MDEPDYLALVYIESPGLNKGLLAKYLLASIEGHPF
jgi:hypothetical protein